MAPDLMALAGVSRCRALAALISVAAALVACQGGDPDRGARLFQERGCHDCHAARTIAYHGPEPNPSRGPDLTDIRHKYRRQQLLHWLDDPDSVYRLEGRRPLNPGYPPMPQVTLSGEEIEDLLAFLAQQ